MYYNNAHLVACDVILVYFDFFLYVHLFLTNTNYCQFLLIIHILDSFNKVLVKSNFLQID